MPDVDMQEIKSDDTAYQGTGTNAMDLTGPGASSDPLKGEYTWTLHNYSTLPDKHISEHFELGGYTWNLLLFPRGNKSTNPTTGQSVSLYLAVPDADAELEGWQRSTRFKLTIVDQRDPSRSHSKDARHIFHNEQNDWGFTTFCSLADLNDPSRGLCVDDTVILRVEVTVTPPDEVAVPSSRATTGFVGLENQGATCYMNSLLQTLYNVNAFRKAVYAMPTSEDEDPSKSMPLALQCVFFRLQFTQGVVSTRDLTASFGWDTVDAFQQHDVQELNRILCDRLEEKMKGTRVEGTVNRLFEGHTLNYIDCINIDYKSQRKEAFQDLQLDVKGCADIYASFDKYCEVETLEGDNKYDAEGHGKQDARKGVLFESLPPVLSLHLKRFEYDFAKDTMVKINDRYDFPEELDLDRQRPDGSGPAYLAHTHEGGVRNRYRLLAVLVHSGGVHGGHYYAYIRPDGSKWLKFDDDVVSVADKQHAVDENYGDGPPDVDKPVSGFAPTQLSVAAAPTRYARAANAYMLVYVRESEWESVMCDVSEEDVSDHVRARLRAEEEVREARRRERAEAHMYTVVRIATDKDLGAQIGHTKFFDLVDFDSVGLQLKMRLKAPFKEVMDSVAERLGVPLERQRYWRWGRRGNDTWRALEPLPAEAPGMAVSAVCAVAGRRAARAGEMIKFDLFLEEPARADQPFLDTKGHALVFFKRYLPESQRLEYAGRALLPLSSSYLAMAPLLKLRAGLEPSDDIGVYEEVKYDPSVLVEEPGLAMTLAATKVEHGDIFILQKKVVDGAEAGVPFPRAVEFMQHVRNRVPVTFRKLDGPLVSDDEGATVQLELLRDMRWDEVSAALAARLGLDHPLKLRFTQVSLYTTLPRNVPTRYSPGWTLEDLVRSQNAAAPTLFYEPIDLPLPEYERLVTYRVAFHNAKHEETTAVTVRVMRDQTIGEMLEEIRAALPAEAHGGAPLRLMEVYHWKIWHMYDPSLPVERFLAAATTPWHLRVEVIPEDQRNLEQEGALHVHCLQVEDRAGTPGAVMAFSDPFIMAIGPTETVGELKERVRVEMGVPEKEFADWKVVAVAGINLIKEELPDDVVVTARLGLESLGPAKLYGHADRPLLGFLHENKNPRKTAAHMNRATAVATQERALKIRA